jgi:hypothetical protein
MSLPSIDKGPDPKRTKLVDQTEEIITLDEEDINQDQDEEEITEPDITATGTANIATTANSQDYFQDHEDRNDGIGDHDNDLINDSTDRTTARDAGLELEQPAAVPRFFISGLNRTKSQNSSVPKARTPYPPRILSAD